ASGDDGLGHAVDERHRALQARPDDVIDGRHVIADELADVLERHGGREVFRVAHRTGRGAAQTAALGRGSIVGPAVSARTTGRIPCIGRTAAGLTPPGPVSRMRGLSRTGRQRPHSRVHITMYAVIATGGKQYRVTKDAVLRVEKLDAEPGSTIEFGEVLLVGEGAEVKLGKPRIDGSKVIATVVRHGKGAKVSIVKFRRRKHYLRRKSHRQPFTEIKVTDISAG